MAKGERFKDLTSVNAELLRLESLRDGHAARLQAHARALKEGQFRGALVKNTVMGAIGRSIPAKVLTSLVGDGSVGSGIGMAVGAGKGGLLKRAGLFILGLAAPKILKQVEALPLPDIGHEFAVSWDRLKAHMKERRAARKTDKATAEPGENVQL